MELIDYNKSGKVDLIESLGLSEERVSELATKMDDLIKSYGDSPVLISAFDVFRDIVKFCDNVPEVIFCTVSHTSWHHKRGIDLCPPNKKQAVNEGLKQEIRKAGSTINNIINEANLWSNVRNEAHVALAFLEQYALQSLNK